jgi:hypothetical protein
MDSTVLDSEPDSEIRGVSRLATSLTTSSFSQGKPTRYPKPFPACLLFLSSSRRVRPFLSCAALSSALSPQRQRVLLVNPEPRRGDMRVSHGRQPVDSGQQANPKPPQGAASAPLHRHMPPPAGACGVLSRRVPRADARGYKMPPAARAWTVSSSAHPRADGPVERAGCHRRAGCPKGAPQLSLG